MSHFREPSIFVRGSLYHALSHTFNINPPKEVIVIDSDMWKEIIDYDNRNINVCERLINNTMRSRNAVYYNNVDGYKFQILNRRVDNILSVIKVELLNYHPELDGVELYFVITYENDEIFMDRLITNMVHDITSISSIDDSLYHWAAFMLSAVFVHEMIVYPD